jgi:hypothetical protein
MTYCQSQSVWSPDLWQRMSVAKEFRGDLWQNILPKSQSLKPELWQKHVVAIGVQLTPVLPDRFG